MFSETVNTELHIENSSKIRPNSQFEFERKREVEGKNEVRRKTCIEI